MRQTALDIDARTGRIELGIRTDDSDIERANAQIRKDIGKGYTPEKTMRAVAEIPFETIQIMALRGDRDAIVLFDTNEDPLAKRKALKNFLFKYPEYRISDGNL